MLKVLSLSGISPNKSTSLKKEIMNLLHINFGDEILFILDENGIVHIRKFKGDVVLGTGEKYLSSSRMAKHNRKTHINTSVAIAREVIQAVNVDIGDKILWIFDEEGNIIIRNNVILDGCSTKIFNKDIGALIIGLTILNYQNKTTGIPKEIVDILGLYEGAKIVFSLDDYDNIIISKEIRKNVLEETIVTGRDNRIYLTNTVIDILDNTDKILWLFDEEGNIIIRNDLLHDNCIQN
jgi:bifunctional DNA-binding transcriptional regulator/antitoxin component of YhaV-PrlF toxin-antitoxin module